MTFVLRDVEATDLSAVLELNQRWVPHLGSVDLQRLQWFEANAHYFRVAVEGQDVLGFLIGLTPEASYDSPNFLWFVERYPSFFYIDRVAVADRALRRGLGRAFYDDVALRAAAGLGCLTCEVNVRPANPDSLVFHQRLGFVEVGRQETEAGAKEVVLLRKPLASTGA